MGWTQQQTSHADKEGATRTLSKGKEGKEGKEGKVESMCNEVIRSAAHFRFLECILRQRGDALFWLLV